MLAGPTSDQISETLPALSKDQVARLVSQVTSRSFAAGDVIIRQGDWADRFTRMSIASQNRR